MNTSLIDREKKWSAPEIHARVAELGSWFHNMDLHGVQTAPDHFLGDYPRIKWKRFEHVIPADLRGRTVLDIGCNAGFYSFEMKSRGADRVVGIDSSEHYLRQARFAAQVHHVDVEFKQLSIWEVGALNEKFDIVLFMGVLYHLRHPLLALDLIHKHVAKDMLIFQSMQRGSEEVLPIDRDYNFCETDIFMQPGYPAMYFVEERYCGDETNWWIPNRACAEAMLRSAGFSIEGHPEQEVYLCRRQEIVDPPDGPHAVYPVPGRTR